MDDSRKSKYESMLKDTKQEIEDIEARIQKELDDVKARITALQGEKEAHLTIYGSYCQLLGVPNDMAAEEGDDADDDE